MAAAGALVASDLPGYTGAASKGQSAGDKAAEAALYRCLGVAAQKFLDRNFGMDYTQGSTEVDSSADVVESAAMAHNMARAGRGNAAAACFKTQFQTGFAQQGIKTTELAVTPVTVEVPGSDEIFAFHVVVTVAGTNGSVPVDSYVINTGWRQVEVTINDTVSGGGKASLADATRLAGIAVQRVRAITG
ncbi:MAG TPA: hypothetical protein VHV82_05905 [Sporichthyaceae bacterium]|nr:hypothetical protein [Sporichthyaceae bacterium]